MKALFALIVVIIGLAHGLLLETNTEDFGGIDYLPATQAFTKIKNVQSEYETFRQKIVKNVTIDYNRCVQIIKESKCNNIDQWQSVIEELKLQTQNSIEVEVPFLKNRKAKKVERLKQLMGVTDQYDAEMINIIGKLAGQQKELFSGAFEVNHMYKLPQPEPAEFEFVQQDINVPAQLNGDVANIAKNELSGAKKQFETADLSIQAEAARDEMQSAGEKMQQVIESLKQAFENKQSEVLEEKRQLKDDIIRIRALLSSEDQIQARNAGKIAEMEGRIAACAGLPMNVEKDCEPIKMRAAKINTEIDIIMARTMKLYKSLGQLMEENESAGEIAAKKDEMEAQRKAAQEKAQEMEFVLPEDFQPKVGAPVDPKELKPKHHLKENLQMQEGAAPQQ